MYEVSMLTDVKKIEIQLKKLVDSRIIPTFASSNKTR